MKFKKEKTGWREILGIVLLGFALFIFLSLFSYSPRDIAFLVSIPNQPPENYVGIFGAWFGFLLFMTIGASSYWLPLLIAGWGLSCFFEREERSFLIKSAASIVLMISFAIMLHMQTLIDPKAFVARHNITGFGGVIGEKATEAFLYPFFGIKGSSIAVVTAFTVSFLLITEKRIFIALDVFWRFLLQVKEWTLFLKDQLVELIQRRMSAVPASSQKRTTRRFVRDPEEDEEEDEYEEDDEEYEDEDEEEDDEEYEDEDEEDDDEEYEDEDEEEDEEEEEEPPKRGLLGRKRKNAPKINDNKPDPKGATAASFNVAMSPNMPNYKLPPISLLDDAPQNKKKLDENLEENSAVLESTLRDFGIEAQVVEVTRGPVITRYEIQLAPGIKVQKITNLQDDIALAMRAASLRILAPIPGKAAVGIEIPNKHASAVVMKELLLSHEFQNFKGQIPFVLGKDVSGKPVVADLATMPHLLIAGATGSGKSVCVNSIILNILFYASPDDVKFLMVDPKMVEMTSFNILPHLITPVITDPKKVPMGLAWVVNEMERRYSVFARVGVRNIQGYNTLPKQQKQNPDPEGEPYPEKYPYIVVLIDELADLMMLAPTEVESAIMRLAQLSRAVGIHLILATQRPSVDVITGVIKANFPARIAFQVSSRVDSRTILDSIGAEKLLGRGDLLFLPPGSSKLLRAQGAWVKDKEINEVLGFIKEQGLQWTPRDIFEEAKKQSSLNAVDDDPLYEDAVSIIKETQQASVSILQRRLRVGYTRAARLMDLLEAKGIVGPYKGSKARDILVEDAAFDD